MKKTITQTVWIYVQDSVWDSVRNSVEDSSKEKLK